MDAELFQFEFPRPVLELQQLRRVDGERLQVVSNLEGGIIREILVKSGDMVTKGQPLVRMDKTLLGADLGTNQATVNALRMKIARLEAEIGGRAPVYPRSEEHTSELQSLMRISYAVFCLKKKKNATN